MLDPWESKGLELAGELVFVLKGEDGLSFEVIFCCKEVLLAEWYAAVALVFLIPNIEENAALMLFRVALASWPKIGNVKY